MTGNGSLRLSAGLTVACLFALAPIVGAQNGSSSGSWTSSSQTEPEGSTNPTRTRQVHTESNGRIIDKTITETLGPDGRYVPYSETEKETVRVNDTTVRTIERNYGMAGGEKTLILQKQEETRTFANGEEKTERTISGLDGSGGLQVTQRETVDTKQVSPGVTSTKSTTYSADGSGGLGATVQTELTEKKTGEGKTEFKKSTMLSDGAGHWQASEVRQGSTQKQAGGGQIKEESVSRPDAGSGNLSVVERTVTRETQDSGGNKRDTTETYSNYVPGLAVGNSLQLVKREDTVQHTGTGGQNSTTQQVEQVNPGDPSSGLQVTQQAIDIVRTGSNGGSQNQMTVSVKGLDGQMHVVLVNTGKSDKPAVVQVDMSKPKAK